VDAAARLMRATVTAGLASVVSCGPALRTVPTGLHGAAASSYLTVPTAPPPARIEQLPPDPGGDCAWLDGVYEWSNEAWQWTPGGWLRVPEGCYYAPPETFWTPTAGVGQLSYRPGRWYRRAGGPAPCEAQRCR